MDKKIISRAEAIAQGLDKYFTGKPCKHGHISERRAPEGVCLACLPASRKKFRANHRDKLKAADAAYYQKNKDRIAETGKAYREKNVEAINKQRKQYREDNREEINARKREISRARYASDDGATQRERTARYKAKDPEAFREKTNATCRRYNARHPEKRAAIAHRRRTSEGSHTAQDLKDIRAAQRDKCAYCSVRLNGGGHLDHIIPVAKGGTNWPRNLQWLCQPCNSKKSSSDPIDYARKTGRLL